MDFMVGAQWKKIRLGVKTAEKWVMTNHTG